MKKKTIKYPKKKNKKIKLRREKSPQENLNEHKFQEKQEKP